MSSNASTLLNSQLIADWTSWYIKLLIKCESKMDLKWLLEFPSEESVPHIFGRYGNFHQYLGRRLREYGYYAVVTFYIDRYEISLMRYSFYCSICCYMRWYWDEAMP